MQTASVKKIVIVTTSQPATNPRAVKEAICLLEAGFHVTLVYTTTMCWATEIDKNIISSNAGITWLQAGKSIHEHKWFYRFVRLRRKFYEIGFKAGLRDHCADYASVLFGQDLYKVAKKLRPDLIIAHNLGALPVAAKISQLLKKPFAFDAEDFHRGEAIEGSFHWKHAKFLEDKYFNSLAYLSTSSTLICEAYQQLYQHIDVYTILNVFPMSYLQIQKAVQRVSSSLKLFWFSQTVGRQRGLEDVITAMGELPDSQIELTILGDLKPAEKVYFDDLISAIPTTGKRITFNAPVNEYELSAIAARHDLGLALELPYCINRELCLTNKIFIYMMGGNALVFSETRAQRQFLHDHPGIGLIYKSGDIEALIKIFIFCLREKEKLAKMKFESLQEAAAIFNWDKEKIILQGIVRAHTT